MAAAAALDTGRGWSSGRDSGGVGVGGAAVGGHVRLLPVQQPPWRADLCNDASVVKSFAVYYLPLAGPASVIKYLQ